MTPPEPMQALPDATIAPMAPEYVESFRRALDTVARERRYLTLLEAPPLPKVREFLLNTIEKGDPQFVAVAKGEVVGWCDIRRHDLPAHAHRGTLGMGIIPAYRGQGLGLRLLKTTLERAGEAGFVRIELAVYADNARAIALYDKAGFVREGVVRDAVLVDGQYRDAIAMALIRPENGARR